MFELNSSAFTNIKIRNKLLFGYAFFTIIIGTGSLYSYFTLQEMSRNIRSIAIINEIRTAVIRIGTLENTFSRTKNKEFISQIMELSEHTNNIIMQHRNYISEDKAQLLTNLETLLKSHISSFRYYVFDEEKFQALSTNILAKIESIKDANNELISKNRSSLDLIDVINHFIEIQKKHDQFSHSIETDSNPKIIDINTQILSLKNFAKKNSTNAQNANIQLIYFRIYTLCTDLQDLVDKESDSAQKASSERKSLMETYTTLSNTCDTLYTLLYSSVESRNNTVTIASITLSFLFLFIAGILSIAMSHLISSPIRKLADVAEKIAKGNYEERIQDTGSDEIGQLGASFNKMVNKLVAEQSFLEAKVKERTLELECAKDKAEEANRTKSTFLSQMSHELRTPLNVIMGCTSLMLDDSSLTQQQQEDTALIMRSSEQLLTLIGDILDFAKIESGNIVLRQNVFQLPQLINGVLEMMDVRAREKNIKLYFEQKSDYPKIVIGDEIKMTQILFNIIGNAMKFTQTGTVVLNVASKPSDISSQIVTIFEIHDTGVGIDEADIGRIFEPFVRVKNSTTQPGTGLGLTITKQFIDLMHGTIRVESILGKGTVFFIEIPFTIPS